MKTKFKATFKNGKVISRTSEKQYEYAYFVPSVRLFKEEVEVADGLGATGFASSYELAEKAARSLFFPTKEKKGRMTLAAAKFCKREWEENKERYAAGNKIKLAGLEIVKVERI